MAKQTPAVLTALGRKPLPDRLDAGGRAYRHVQTFKNDFFAVTALYAPANGDAEARGARVLLKVGRQASFFGVPLAWIGRFLANREVWFLTQLADEPAVPKLIERWGRAGLVREFVEGHPLARGEQVADDFHPQLQALVGRMHARGMAYVDLEKCENVVVGDDGGPHLIDFQIAWAGRPRWLAAYPPGRWLGRCLQAGDRYHLVKLQRRTRPDQLSEAELAASYRRPWYVRLHRRLTWPFTKVRRWVLDRVDPRRAPGERGRVPDDDTVGVL